MSGAGGSRGARPARIAGGLDTASLDAALDAGVAGGRVPGLVAAITDSRGIVYERAVGMAAASSGRAMRFDTVFRVASMTKLLTSVAVMMLHEEGRFGLDDEFVRHVAAFRQPDVLAWFDEETGEYGLREAARAVTVRDLLTHVSGFGYWFLAPELLRAYGGAVEHFSAPFLMHDPGERFTYGISTDVLGQIVEPTSGRRLDEFVAARVADPLGMAATGWRLPDDPSRLAALHRRRDGRLAEAPMEAAAEAPHGGGGMYSTAEDYLRLLRMLLNDGLADGGRGLLRPESVHEMTSNQIGALFARPQTTAYPERSLDFAFLDGTQKFGFNVSIETRPAADGRPAGSAGWAGIFNTYYWLDREAGLAAVLLMQLSPFCDPACLETYRAFARALYRR